MKKHIFWLLFVVVLVFAYVLRVIPAQNNNFFFTMDQGDDAVHAREFFERGQLLFRGPETGIRGIFAGPGWYYFISIGYKLFSGHPFGALFMVVLLSLATTALVMWQIGKHVGPGVGLLVGVALQFNWFFYDTSRWAFNPFVLVFLSFVLILLLVRFLGGDRRAYVWAVIPIILAFNTEVAGAAAMFVFYFLVGLWGMERGKLGWKEFLIGNGVLPAVGLVGIAKQAASVAGFNQGNALGTFSGTNFVGVGQVFLEIVGDSVIPQSIWVSVILFIVCYLLFAIFGKRDEFRWYFVNLTVVLFGVSYFFFASNRGWQDWHDLYLPPLLFVSVLLMLFSLWRELKVRYYKAVWCVLFGLVVGSQLWVFSQRYKQYLRPSDDPSILTNQLKVLDWIYTHNEDDGFNLYTASVSSFYDYHYQYLVWWYGRRKYGFVPCEYSNFPKSIKYLYVPGAQFYSEPKLGCGKLRFLIVESGADFARVEKSWEGIIGTTELAEEARLGSITVQKRKIRKN